MAIVMIVLVLGVLAAGLWYQSRYPREIVGTSSLVVESRRAGGQRSTHEVRTVRIKAATFQEVRMPNGTWIGCAGDCVQAVREAGDEFWDAHQPPRK
jgi:hypothetical protein